MKEMTLEATVANLDAVIDFVSEELISLGCPTKTLMQIQLAVEEVYVNIANYAYAPGQGPATILMEVSEAERKISFTFIDKGFPYNPLEKEDVDVTLPAEQRKIGGLGIYLVKQNMDDLHYEFTDGKNIFTISKSF